MNNLLPNQQLYLDSQFSNAASHFQVGDLSAAESECRNILQKDKSNSPALALLGMVAYKTGHNHQALSLIKSAIKLEPHVAKYYFELGLIFHSLKKTDEEISSYRKALDIKEDYLPALVNLANLLITYGGADEVENLCKQAINVDSHQPQIYNNLGQLYLQRGDLYGSMTYFKKALKIEPKCAETTNNLGVAFQLMGDIDKAIQLFSKALELDSNSELAKRNMSIAVLNSPVWRGSNRFNLLKSCSQALNQKETRKYNFSAQALKSKPKLKLGYISSDFHNHPVGKNLYPLISEHDRSRFEIYLYSCSEKTDELTQSFRENSDIFRELSHKTIPAIADIIYSDQVDIIVYLAGRFNQNKSQIAAYRPAPVQISFHDCATSGIPEMDYWLTDNYLHPINTEELSTEKLYRLKQFYQFSKPNFCPHIVNSPFQYNNYVTFGSFCKPEKINEEVLKVWVQLLQKINNSKLLLKYKNYYDYELKKKWLKKFKKYGISPNRIILLAHNSTDPDHLAFYNQIDITLDPFPFNGATSTFESLLMGVPVISLNGETFVSRVSSTILKQCKQDEFVCDSYDDYILNAIRASQLTKNGRIKREKIRQMLLNSPLLNHKEYAKQVETAYLDIWKNLTFKLK